MLLISPAATLDEITSLEDRGLINRTVPPDSDQGPVLADAIADDLGGAKGKVVDVAARADSYGEGLTSSFEQAWEEKGGEVGTEAMYEPGDEELRRRRRAARRRATPTRSSRSTSRPGSRAW